MNPKNCEKGLSASLFYKLEFDVNPDDLETNFTKKFTREYILSTGTNCTTLIYVSLAHVPPRWGQW